MTKTFTGSETDFALFPFTDFTFPFSGRWSKYNLRPWISFNHVVRHVTYNEATDDFSVVVKNLSEDRVLPAQRFDYVIVATGHFSVPNIPSFPGIDKFPGRVLHSHAFRNASHFKDKNLLVVGSSLSAEDIAIQCLKYGAKSIVCTWQTKPMGFPFPPEITERPLLTRSKVVPSISKTVPQQKLTTLFCARGIVIPFPFLKMICV